ncbi:unnamed protein product [Dracunculus medinensis]|uniref:Endo/exonuclease/phosphatase domain-containing protein n=1 Tax=Dracunculus medinensis TaxID=318479 RepID=A0A0N4UD87_DRAME|nr:unnamed protein product [Dracunculus medinensis]
MSKIRVAAGDPPVTLSPNDCMVKGSDTLDTASASPGAHDTSSPVVHAISIQSGLKVIPSISVISVYTPTLSANDRDKDKFYAELQLLTKSLSKYDMIIIGGDWNARVGHNAAAITSTIGKYGIGYRCANGERLLRYAEKHEKHFLLLILAFGI